MLLRLHTENSEKLQKMYKQNVKNMMVTKQKKNDGMW